MAIVDDARPRELERIRAMTPEERVRASHALWLEARRMIEARVRAGHPAWFDAEVAAEVRAVMLAASTEDLERELTGG